MRPLISVVLPVRDEPRLPLAVHSILNQSFGDLELIIVDDGSEIDYKLPSDSRIRFIPQTRQNVAVAINRGIAEAKGVIIARQDGDDISAPHRLKRQLEFLIDENLDACSCQWDYLDDTSHPPSWRLPTDPEKIIARLSKGNVLGGGYWMARKRMVDRVGKQTWDYPGCADWEWWLKAICIGIKIGTVDEILYYIYYQQDKKPEWYIQMQRQSGRRLQEAYAQTK